MRRFISYFILVLATLLPYMVLATPAVFAASTTNYGQALEIAPPVTNLSVNPGQTIKIPVYLRDISDGDLVVTGQANDFIANGVDGTPKILMGSESSPYSLKNWVSTLPTLTLVSHEIKTMQVTLKVPADATPGGHYGVIRFTATPPTLNGTGVSLAASLGALLLITVNGNIQESLHVTQFSASQNNTSGTFFESGPINFIEQLQNTGNVHEQPIGQVSVTDMFGKNIAHLNVNLPPGNILPDSSRQFEEPLDNTVIGDRMLFGRYTATMHITYGANKTALVSSLTFWVVPYRLILGVILTLVAGFFLFRFLIRRYNQHVIRQASRLRR